MRRSLVAWAASSLLASSLLAPSAAQAASDEAPDIAAAVERTLAVGTVGIQVSAMMSLPGLLEPLQIVDGTGQTSLGSENELWFEGWFYGLDEEMHFIWAGDHMYFGGGSFLPAGSYLHIDTTAMPPGFESLSESAAFGTDATLMLYWLLGADGPPEPLGSRASGGNELVGLMLPIDLTLVGEQMPAELRPMFDGDLAEMHATGGDVDRAEVWIDDHGYVRSVAYDMSITADGTTATSHVTFEFFDHGAPVALELPDEQSVVDAWDFVGGD